jgi:hypothetical protein
MAKRWVRGIARRGSDGGRFARRAHGGDGGAEEEEENDGDQLGL